MTFNQGDRVVLLSVPLSDDRDETYGVDGVGETHTVYQVTYFDDERWYIVNGWFVREQNLRIASK